MEKKLYNFIQKLIFDVEHITKNAYNHSHLIKQNGCTKFAKH